MDAAPELSSVEEFVEFLFDDEREEFTHVELRALAYNTRTSGSKVRKELESYGLSLAHRAHGKRVRGFTSNPHDRWYGPGSCRTHGGTGWEQINGFAGQEG